MATDIYSLVQQKLAQSQSGQRQYTDPTAGITLDIVKMIQSNKDKENIADRQLLSDINTMAASSNDSNALNNLLASLNNTSVGQELEPIKQAISTGIENKTAQYISGAKVYAKLFPTFGKDMTPGEDKYNLTQDKILNMNFGYDENGNKIELAQGESGLDWLTKEIQNTAVDLEHLKQAQKFNYRKMGNVPVNTMIAKLQNYYDNLNETFLAVPGGISEPEANVIFFQKDYAAIRDDKLSEADRGLIANDRERLKWQTALDGISKATTEEGRNQVFRILDMDQEFGATPDMQPSEYVQSLTDRINNLKLDDEVLYRTKRFWSKGGETPSEATSYEEGADVVTPGVVTPANRQEQIDKWVFDNPAASDAELETFIKSLDEAIAEPTVSPTTAPTTGAQVTGAPVTGAPTTVTGGPVVEPPATVVTATEAPVAEPPANLHVGPVTDLQNQITQIEDEIKDIIQTGADEGLSEQDIEEGKGPFKTGPGVGENELSNRKKQINVLNEQLDNELVRRATEDQLNITTDDGKWIDIDATVDFIEKNKNEIVATTGAAGGAAYTASKIKGINNATKSAQQFLRTVGGLTDTDIAKIFSDSRVQDKISQLDILDKERIKAPSGWLKSDLGRVFLRNRRKSVDELALIFNNLGIKFKGKNIDWTKGTGSTHIRKILEQSNMRKWNLFNLKAATGGLRQLYKAPADLLKTLGRAGIQITPLDGAIWGWYLGDKAGLTDWKAKFATGAAGYGSMKYITKKVMEKGGWLQAMKNPVLTSKIGQFLITKAPWVAAKLGLKAGVAGLLSGTGIGTAFGIGLGVMTLNDIKNLVLDYPEIKQALLDYAEGKYDEAEPTITQPEKHIERRELYSTRSPKLLPEAGGPGKLLEQRFKDEYVEPTMVTGTAPMTSRLGVFTPDRPYKLESKYKREEKESLKEFKDKYNLNDKIMSMLVKLNSPTVSDAQKKRIRNQLIKELKKIGIK